jgi:hypothetical protein
MSRGLRRAGTKDEGRRQCCLRPSYTSFVRLLPCWRLALREECVSYNLTCLPPGGILAGTEVGQVARRVTRFPFPSTWVPLHDAQAGQAPDVGVEGVAGGYVLELLCTRRLGQPCRLCHYLGELPTGDIGVRSEVRPVVGGYARLAWTTAWVACDDAPEGQPPYVVEEGRPNRHVLELLRACWVGEASGVGDYLG